MAFVMSLVLFTVIHAVLFMALYCAELEMALWQSFICLRNAGDSTETVEGNEQ